MEFKRHWDGEEIEEITPHSVNNFENQDRPKVEVALAEFELRYPSRAGELFISNTAYTRRGHLLEDHFSLMHTTREDLSDFWKIYDALKEVK